MSSEPLRCATCGAELERLEVDHGVMWSCRHCGGRAVGLGLLQRTVAADPVRVLWAAAVSADDSGTHRCPSCAQAMIAAPTRELDLDICVGCQLLWFDPGEFDTAAVARSIPRRPLSDEDREALARRQATAIAAEYKVGYNKELPLREALLLVPGVMGLPLEEESPAAGSIPWATWTIAALVFGASMYAFFDTGVVETLGLVPRSAFRFGGATFVTAFFIHSGVFLMIVNLYFLAIFGDNVEEWLGRAGFVMLVAIGALVGEGLHALLADERTAPFTGATAGVAAIVLFYGLKFPGAKLRYLRLFRWYTMPASAAVLLWFLTNVLGRSQQLIVASESSPWVYLGGGAVGILFWLVLRNERALA